MSTFLIADDSDAKAMWLEAIVKKSKIAENVLRTRTTDEAKALIDREAVDFAFIDYEMPTEDGPAVIAYLREKQPNTRIALVSSSNSEARQEKATEAGSEAYICTSFQEDIVVSNLQNLLEEWS